MPTRIERQIVSEVLSTCGVRSNNNDREAAAINVAALLANYGFGQAEPPNGAAVSDTPTVADSITFTALLGVLERLRSKCRNPENQWYHGWNGAIQCLINDINARSVTPTVAASDPAKCPNCAYEMELQNVCENCGHRQQ